MLPSLSQSSGVAHDKWSVRFYSLTIKCWLHDVASRRMQRSVRREKALAQEPFRAIESAAFHEPVVMRQEDVFNRRGVIEEKREVPAQLKRDDLVWALCQLLQEGKWVILPPTQSPERTGWISW